ncbi:MAG: cadherin domain-containing protein, partial [Magnetococcus sp. YQC-5]
MGNLLHNKWLVAILILAFVAAAGGYLLLAPTTPETSKGIVLERAKIARPEKPSTPSTPSTPTDPDQPSPIAPAKRDVVGTVTQFKGLAFANFENIKRTLADGDPLFQGDQIITGKDARLILKMQDDAVIALGPDSEFLIQDYQFSAKDQTGNGLVNMTQGMVKFTSGKIAQLKNRPFKVVTPVATMGVRGTEGFARLVKGQSKDLEIEVITLQKEILVWMEDPSSRTTGSLGEIYFSPAWSLISEAVAADTSKDPVNVKQNERLSGSPNKAPEVRKATRDELKGAHAATVVRKLSPKAQQNIVTQLAKSLVEKGAAKDIKSAEQMLAKSPEAMHEVIEKAEENLYEETVSAIDKKLDKEEKIEQLNAKIKEAVGEEAFAKMQAAEEKLQAKQEILQQEAEKKLKEKLGDETLVAAAQEIEAEKADKKAALATETEEKLANAVGEDAMEKLKAIEAEKEKKAAALEKETEKALQEILGPEKAEQIKQLLAEKADKVGLVAKETEEAIKAAVPEEKLFEKAKEIAEVKAAKPDMTVKELNDQLKVLPDVQAAKVKEILLNMEQEATKVEKTTTAKIKEVTDAQKHKDVKAILNLNDQKAATLQKEVAAQIQAVVPPEQAAKAQAILSNKEKQTSSIERMANQQMKEALPPAAISQVKSVMAETQELTQAAKIETTKQVAAVVPPEKQAAFQTIQKEKEQVQSIPTVNLAAISTSKPSETLQKEAVKTSSVAVEQFANKIATEVKSGKPLDQILQNKATEVKTQQTNDATRLGVNLNEANTVQNTVKKSGESPGAAPTTIPVTPTPGPGGESTGAPSTGTVPKTTPEPAAGSGGQTDTKPDGIPAPDTGKPAPDTGKPATNTTKPATDVPGPVIPPVTGSILGLGPGTVTEPAKSTPASTPAASTIATTSVPVSRTPPTVTSASTATLAENDTGKVYIATATGLDTNSLKWSLDGPDVNLFKITTNEVSFNTPPDFENPKDVDKKNIYNITVIATDKNKLTASKAVAVTVTNANEAPVVTSASTATFAENSTGTVYTATATDADAGDTLTWSLTGTDAALFDIDTSKGTILFKTSPDFENPKDKNQQNKYEITATVTDKGALSGSKAITITVTDVNEAPVITSEATASFAENSTDTAYTATGIDRDNGDPIKWSLSGPDASLFKIQLATGEVTFITPPNFEDPKDADQNNIYNIDVVTTDKGNLTTSKAVAITVTNVDEDPVITSASTATFAENSTGAVYTATAIDADASDTVTWSLTGTDAALFDIDTSKGTITFKTSPDFEVPKDANRQNTYKFNVVATDKGALTNIKALTITITDVNEAPIVTSDATVSFAENATGTVLTATANDPDAGDTLTWSLNGIDKDLFDIDTNKGSVTFKTAPNFEAPKDQDRNNIYEIILVATDKGKLTGSKAVAITVTNLNEAPQVTSSDTASFVENTIGPVLTATASDVDANDTLTWSLTGKDASLFDIDATKGILTFKSPPNFEAPKDTNRKNTYEINLVATDTGGLSGSKPVTINVTDIHDAPQVTSAAAASFAENKTGTVYAATASDEDANDTVTWTLSGVDAALFNLDPTTGIITFKTPANFEKPKDANEKNIYSLTVTATDKSGVTGSKAVAITVTNANDAPQITSGSTATFAENATGTVYTATGTDEDSGDSIQWTLSGNDASLFAIDPATGAVTFKTPPNFEFSKDADRNNIYEISVTATDKEGATAIKPVAITVTNLNDAPVITSGASTSFPEFSTATAYTATGTDEDAGDAITWSLTGVDASLFNLNTTTGLVTFKTPPATATPQDADGNNIYSIHVVATDNAGLFTSKAVAITVVNITNLPQITSGNTANFTENDTAKVYTATATGMDPGNTVTWSVTGTDAALFKMDASTGDLTFKTAPNFEFPTDGDRNNIYDINVVATIKGGQTTKAVAITVTNVNEAPVITSTGSASFAENGTGTVITTTATDEDSGDTLTWSLTGTDASHFDINPTTGAVIFKKSPDFEAPKDTDINNIYAINVVATDKGGLTSSKALVITVTDVNESPTITSGPVASFAENSSGTAYTATGTDLDAGDSLFWSIIGTDAALFKIDAATGEVSFKTPPNYEDPKDLGGKNIYNLSVVATDKGGLTASKAVAITVTDANDAPLVTSGATASFPENSTTAAYTAVATDEDSGDSLTWSITGTDAGLFKIDSTTREVTFKTPPDFESPKDLAGKNIYNINVIATDKSGLSASKAVTITVTNVNEAPTVTSGSLASFQENSTGAVYTATASDVDASDTLSWTLSGTDATLFAIDATKGSVTFITPPNFEDPKDVGRDNVYDITVIPTDKGGLSASKAVAITVTDLNDAPQITSASTASFVENSTATAYSAVGADEDKGDPLTWSLSGQDVALFSIDPASGAITFKTPPDFETPKDSAGKNIYNINLIVTDKAGLSSTKAVAITVTNVNEAPTVTSGTTATFSENSTGTVATATATDVDAGDSHTWSLSGVDASLFNMDASKGTITFKTPPNFEDPKDTDHNNAYEINTVATDKGGLSGSRALTITVTNLNDAPQVTSAGSASFVENGTGTVYTAIASDEDANETITWSLNGTDANLFNIDAATGAVTFKDPPNFEAPKDSDGNNVYDIIVVATDKGKLTGSKVVTITVMNVNEAPVITSPALATFAENGTGTVYAAIGTDDDAGDGITWSLTSTDASLFNMDATTGVITFKNSPDFESPKDADQNNVYEISVIATDKAGKSTSKAVTITVTNLNEAPVAVEDTGVSSEAGGTANGIAGNSATGNVLTNDLDPETDPLTVTAIRTGSVKGGGQTGTLGAALSGNYGLLTLKSDGSYTYVASENNPTVQALKVGQTISDSFNYTVSDGKLTDMGVLTVSIQGANDAPVGVNGTGNATEAGGTANGTAGNNATGNVLTNDTDPESDTLTAIAIRTGDVEGNGTSGKIGTALTGSYGSLTLNNDGSFSYTINDSNTTVQALKVNQSLTESFNYTLSDGSLTDMAVVTITIQGANDAPVGVDDTGSATEAGGTANGTGGSSATGNVLSNDTDPESDTLTATAIRTGSIKGSGTAGVIGTALTGSYGSLTLATNGAYTYTVNNNNPTVQALKVGQTLSDAFNYTLSDGNATDMGLLTITIHGANDAPVGVDDTGNATEAGGVANATAGSNATGTVLSNDTDAESDTLTVTGIRVGSVKGEGVAGILGTSLTGSYGALTLNASGGYTYVIDNTNSIVDKLPVGQTLMDSFNYTLSDGTLTDTGVLTITIQGGNETPIGVDDVGTATEASGTANGTAGSSATGNLLTNDTDVDTGTTLTVTGIRVGSTEGIGTAGTIGSGLTGSYGSLTVNTNGSYTYLVSESNTTVQALKVGQSITDTFNYTLSDGTLTDTALLTITI